MSLALLTGIVGTRLEINAEVAAHVISPDRSGLSRLPEMEFWDFFMFSHKDFKRHTNFF
jgi:hypothetical protein